MGKRIIIRGADFRMNGIKNMGLNVVPLLGYPIEEAAAEGNAMNNIYFMQYSSQQPLLMGRTILGVRINIGRGGTLTTYVATGFSGDVSVNEHVEQQIVKKQTFIVQSGLNDLYFEEPIVVDSEDMIIGFQSDGKGLTVLYQTGERYPVTIYKNASGTSWKITPNYRAGMDYLVEE